MWKAAMEQAKKSGNTQFFEKKLNSSISLFSEKLVIAMKMIFRFFNDSS